jgi:four helix bundle protein
MLGHERLLAWDLCHKLALSVYRASESWPVQERYGITSQVRRAVVSAPTNLAEGAGKHGSREFRRYIDIALGSLAETAYLLTLARDLGILSSDEWATLDEQRRRAGGITWRLARSLDLKRQ